MSVGSCPSTAARSERAVGRGGAWGCLLCRVASGARGAAGKRPRWRAFPLLASAVGPLASEVRFAAAGTLRPRLRVLRGRWRGRPRGRLQERTHRGHEALAGREKLPPRLELLAKSLLELSDLPLKLRALPPLGSELGFQPLHLCLRKQGPLLPTRPLPTSTPLRQNIPLPWVEPRQHPLRGREQETNYGTRADPRNCCKSLPLGRLGPSWAGRISARALCNEYWAVLPLGIHRS